MDGLDTLTVADRGIDAALRHDRRIALAGLVLVVAASWVYLWHSAMGMDSGAMDMHASARAPDTLAFALTFAMWAVMMVAMMLPSAAPTILLYGTLVRRHGVRGTVLPGVWIFAGAYVLVWLGFSAAATLLQTWLEHAALLTPGLAIESTRFGGYALIAAGVYQGTPLKQACLSKCRNPLEFFITRWRAGAGGAFRMGAEHGAYCVGCCWALMLVLFVAGIMNLVWIGVIAAFILVEKLLPPARAVSRASSAALILWGLYLLMKA